MANFGPANQARQYFIDIGYEPANKQTTTDFLVAVTDPNGRIPRASVLSLSRSVIEFAEYFKASAFREANRADIDSYCADFVRVLNRASAYIESAQVEFARTTSKGSRYTISIPMQVRAVVVRRVQILRGDMIAVGLNLFSFIFQAIIMITTGTVFLKVPQSTDAYFSRGGVLFFAILFSALTTMAEIPAL